MQQLVIYYSLDGNTEIMAKAIADLTGSDIQKLIPQNQKNYKGFFKIFLNVLQVIMKKKPILKTLSKNPSKYDTIFIGTPVWAGQYTPAIRTLLHDYNFSGKKIAMFCSFAGEEGKAFSMLRDDLHASKIIGQLGLKNPAKIAKDELMKQVSSWINTLKL